MINQWQGIEDISCQGAGRHQRVWVLMTIFVISTEIWTRVVVIASLDTETVRQYDIMPTCSRVFDNL